MGGQLRKEPVMSSLSRWALMQVLTESLLKQDRETLSISISALIEALLQSRFNALDRESDAVKLVTILIQMAWNNTPAFKAGIDTELLLQELQKQEQERSSHDNNNA